MPFQGEDVDRLINCNQKLKELGIDATIKLPQLVVVGDQSAGKSSLIEALSMVKVPRAASCCTQCPLSINISAGDCSDAEWKCKVLIEEHYEYDPATTDKLPTSEKPFGPWNPRRLTTHLFKTTSDKDEVCHLIKAAQLAILNPGRQRVEYLSDSLGSTPQTNLVKFSPNIVRLDITQGGFPTLSFIDLPGVIASPDRTEEDYLVPLLENLVKKYAGNPNTINLLTLPMTNDLVNSKGRRIIQEIGAESRTLAVLTKPDRAQEDSHEQYMRKFLEKEDPVFAYGYRVVMMDPNLQLEHAEARCRESEFFTREPWASLDVGYKARLGVESLRGYLQQVLFTKIRDALPDNLRDIEVRLGDVNTHLARLPSTPDLAELPLLIERLMTKFSDYLRKIFEGGPEADQQSFLQQWNAFASDFRNYLTQSHPTLHLRSDEDDRRIRNAQAKRARAGNAAKTKHTTKTTETIDISSDDESPLPRPALKPKPSNLEEKDSNTGVQATDDQVLFCRFRLEQVRTINQSYSVTGMPRQAYPLALKEMMRMTVSKWDKPVGGFMHAVAKLINIYVRRLVDVVFAKFRRFDFFTAVMDWVKNYLDQAIQEEWSRAEALLSVEQSTPYTLDVQHHSAKYEQNLTEKVNKRNAIRLKVMQAELEASNSKSKKQLTLDALPPDDFKIEVEMVAHVRGYYDIAATRFADVVCQGIVACLFTGCSEELAADLKAFIGVDRPEQQVQLQQWMSENPEVERERQKLCLERSRLIEGKEYILSALGNTNTNNNHCPGFSSTSNSARASPSLRTPASTPTKRGVPPEFDQEQPSTNKKLPRVSKLSIRSPPRDVKNLFRRASVEDAPEEDDDTAFL